MRILALDTATQLCGVALTEEDRLLAECRLNLKNAHNEKLVALVERLTREARWSLQQVQAIAVSIGPGSFTGLRIGVTVAKGLAYSLGIPLIGVNTLDSLAEQAHFWRGPICTLIKARAATAYFALFERQASAVRRISDYQIIDLAELESRLPERTLVIAHPQDLVQVTSTNVELAPPDVALPSPVTVARLGLARARKGQFENLAEAEPFYLQEFKPKKKAYYGV